MKNIHPFNKIKIIGTLVGIVVLGLIVGIKIPDHATASAGNNVHGWAFSDMPSTSDRTVTPSNFYGGQGLGYASMNSDDAGMSGNYGVTLDAAGELSGQAWSEYGGWLNFDASGPYPPYNAGTSAKIMPSCWNDAAQDTCKVTGWAKYSSGGSPQSGGWDGWVGFNSDFAPEYHVTYTKSSGQFSGKAWGGTVAGWVSFDNVKADVPLTLPLFCVDSSSGHIIPYTDPANIPAQCKSDLVCYKEPGHVAVTYAIGSPIPSQCTTPVGLSICYSQPGNVPHAYVTGTAVPAVCLSTVDLCRNIAGVQSVLPVFSNGVWYENPSGSGNCTPMTTPPVIGCMNPKANNYNPLATIDDVCTFDGTGGPKGPLTPIYKEN